MAIDDLYSSIIDEADMNNKIISEENMSRIRNICTSIDIFISDINDIEGTDARIKGNNLEVYILVIDFNNGDSRENFINLVELSDSIYFMNLEDGEILQMTFIFNNIMEDR